MCVRKTVTTFLVMLLLPSCAKNGTEIDRYITENASFTMKFPATYELNDSSTETESGESVTVSCIRNGEGVNLSVVSPKRSENVSVSVGFDGQCVISVGSMSIPLSENVSVGLYNVCMAMYPDEYSIIASDDGKSRLVISEYGTACVDENGVPEKITCGEREIIVSDYVPQLE